MTRSLALAIALAVGPIPSAAGQETVAARGAAFVERYSFDAGLRLTDATEVNDVLEITVPVGVTVPLGRYAYLAVSSGFATLRISPRGGGDDVVISGALDTEFRLSWTALPGNLVVFVNGAVPTGVETLDQREAGALALLASDVIGFAATTLGTGGNVGAGFAGAVPLGTWALGLGATFREPLSFEPVAGADQELKPGREVRVRTAVEGPLGSRSYLRVAGIASFRAKDEFDQVTTSGVGNRVAGYVSFDQGVGRASLTLYAFDVFRGDPRIEETAVGLGLLPRSNLLAGGARLAVPVGPSTTVVPRAEVRNSWISPDPLNGALETAGRSVRFGADLRQTLSSSFRLVVQGEGLFGVVKQPVAAGTLGSGVNLRGFRAALHIEMTR